MRLTAVLLCYLSLLLPLSVAGQPQVYEVSKGTVRFHSDAQHELIKASSDNLAGIVDIAKRTFYFKISIASFVGFNSPLQKEHFNESYMESDIFPIAVYTGKIIEDINLSVDGDFNIRTKGKLTIHGVDRQCIIKCHITCKKGVVTIQSDFVVLLADYNIKIPRIVYDKLSPEINVSINAILLPRTSS